MKRLMILVFPMICLAVVLICMGSLHGGPAGSSEEKGTVSAGGPGLSDLILRVGLALGLIVLLIWGAVYTLRLLGRRTGGPLQGRFKVLDRCYLAPKRALYSVRMGERGRYRCSSCGSCGQVLVSEGRLWRPLFGILVSYQAPRVPAKMNLGLRGSF